MKKVIISSAILLAACSPKQSTDSPPQTAPAAPADQTQAPAQLQDQGQNQAVPPPVAKAPAPYRNSAAQPRSYQSEDTQQYPSEYSAPEPQPVVSVYVDPPLVQPPPVRVEWAPPPMLVESPPPPPNPDSSWTGGYWAWQGDWVWIHGRWSAPPRRGYQWQNPYYEHRGDSVVFVDGYWRAPGVSFVAPSSHIDIALAIVAAGIRPGPRPRGPEGTFVPPPPGSYHGLIVPAPINTAPAVVTGAPPIVREGMHIDISNNTSNVKNVTNISNVTNVTNVTVVAPANSTANGVAVHAAVPGKADLAAAMPPVVRATAPQPASSRALQSFVPGQTPATLPTPQTVTPQAPPEFVHARPQNQPGTPEPGRQREPVPATEQPHAMAQPAPTEQAHPEEQPRPMGQTRLAGQAQAGQHSMQQPPMEPPRAVAPLAAPVHPVAPVIAPPEQQNRKPVEPVRPVPAPIPPNEKPTKVEPAPTQAPANAVHAGQGQEGPEHPATAKTEPPEAKRSPTVISPPAGHEAAKMNPPPQPQAKKTEDDKKKEEEKRKEEEKKKE